MGPPTGSLTCSERWMAAHVSQPDAFSPEMGGAVSCWATGNPGQPIAVREHVCVCVCVCVRERTCTHVNVGGMCMHVYM